MNVSFFTALQVCTQIHEHVYSYSFHKNLTGKYETDIHNKSMCVHLYISPVFVSRLYFLSCLPFFLCLLPSLYRGHEVKTERKEKIAVNVT